MKSKEENNSERPHLGVFFECCGVYSRIYRKPEDKEYRSRCPKCLKPLVVRVDEKNGVAAKMLKAW